MYSQSLRHALLAALSVSLVKATQYQLEDDFTGGSSSFFDNFEFFTATDPTGGFVQYIDQSQAQTANLIGFNTGTTSNDVSQVSSGSQAVYIGVDSQTANPASGRQSVRITSKKTYSTGFLLIADVAHVPTGCGTWPALWMLGTGAEWPIAGEVDIIENVNAATSNSMTLHTNAGCSIESSSSSNMFSGRIATDNCDVNAPDQDTNQGCSIEAPENLGGATYGPAFNQQGGGTYAMEWSSDGIAIWFFPQGSSSTPSSLTSQSPDTSSFGTPVARFAGSSCDWDAHFTNMNIIIDTTLCGQWAGQDGVWADGGCKASTGFDTCQAFVAAQPSAFSEAYWSIRSLRTFTSSGSGSGSSSGSGYGSDSGEVSGSSPVPETGNSAPAVPAIPAPQPEQSPLAESADGAIVVPNVVPNNGIAPAVVAPQPAPEQPPAVIAPQPAPAPAPADGSTGESPEVSGEDDDEEPKIPVAGPTAPTLISYRPDDPYPTPTPNGVFQQTVIATEFDIYTVVQTANVQAIVTVAANAAAAAPTAAAAGGGVAVAVPASNPNGVAIARRFHEAEAVERILTEVEHEEVDEFEFYAGGYPDEIMESHFPRAVDSAASLSKRLDISLGWYACCMVLVAALLL